MEKTKTANQFWSVEIIDHHPILGGKTVKFPFAFRAHAERWAKDEVSAAKEFGMDCSYKVNHCAA